MPIKLVYHDGELLVMVNFVILEIENPCFQRSTYLILKNQASSFGWLVYCTCDSATPRHNKGD